MNAGELRFRLLSVPDDVEAVEACRRVGVDLTAQPQSPATTAKTKAKTKAKAKKEVTG